MSAYEYGKSFVRMIYCVHCGYHPDVLVGFADVLVCFGFTMLAIVLHTCMAHAFEQDSHKQQHADKIAGLIWLGCFLFFSLVFWITSGCRQRGHQKELVRIAEHENFVVHHLDASKAEDVHAMLTPSQTRRRRNTKAWLLATATQQTPEYESVATGNGHS